MDEGGFKGVESLELYLIWLQLILQPCDSGSHKGRWHHHKENFCMVNQLIHAPRGFQSFWQLHSLCTKERAHNLCLASDNSQSHSR